MLGKNDANNLFDQTFGHFVYTAFIVGARGDYVDDPNHLLTTLRLRSPELPDCFDYLLGAGFTGARFAGWYGSFYALSGPNRGPGGSVQ